MASSGRFAARVRRSGTRAPHRSWPYLVAGAALAMLGACGVTVLVIGPRANSSTSLASRADWVLAGALPSSDDFPADWGYSLSGWLRRSSLSETTASSTAPQLGPRAVYEPAQCTKIPQLLTHSGAALAAELDVDRYTQLIARDARIWDWPATGETDEHGPNAHFEISVVPDGPQRIANYLDWLGRCGSYQVTNYDFNGRFKDHRSATTVLQDHWTDDAVVAAVVTRTFVTADSHEPPATYLVSYYALRGVILECSVHMETTGDRELVQRRAAETLHRLRAL
ncbi:hypothetical protein LAUMK35_04227 [Mycobacterium pseudokansasii]|uniref:PknH-like extracellular domain-containing protein n=1 Tax=Mycobacterium pseudokansasii TaxID=2341080 RepID=A0A498QUW0_9MYCO|nr:hypothetical protein A4G27_06240 [Mycobacterium kansasii]VAZ99130.1 hypothetical protein LAUMK35_04227 [Mycobacterium pseudokansasii]VBA30297.1 hypothetical protein LAUMK21_04222 [Mycobacterium pseudokansasii]VBA53519.1 hypothetical protein LAUMK142_04118 [Mycobacterium pseudokansasii]